MEREKDVLSRREFVTAAAAGAAAGIAALSPRVVSAEPAPAPAAEPAQDPPKKGRPKVGCVSWCFHSFSGGASPEEAIDTIAEIGFEGLDLILLARADIEGFWTDARVDAIKKRLDEKRLAVAQFVIFQPVVEGLTSTDKATRAQNLDYFEAGCKLGARLGAPIVDIVAPWARELRGPGGAGGYLPRYYEIPEPKPGEKFHIDVDAGFDWDRVWEVWVESVKACLERVKAHGMKLSIEHHTHTVMPDAVSFLRLWDAIRDPALGYNLDTGWTLLQREYPPVAIHKVRRQLMNLHVRDIDGRMRQFIHVGTGVMDFRGVAEALKRVGFDGFLSIEQDKFPGDMRETCKRYLAMMKEYLA
jgi:sugar phosphate isomerase/epimerase